LVSPILIASLKEITAKNALLIVFWVLLGYCKINDYSTDLLFSNALLYLIKGLNLYFPRMENATMTIPPEQPISAHDQLVEHDLKDIKETTHQAKNTYRFMAAILLIQVGQQGYNVWHDNVVRKDQDKQFKISTEIKVKQFYDQQMYFIKRDDYKDKNYSYNHITYNMKNVRFSLETINEICSKPLTPNDTSRLKNNLENLRKNIKDLTQAYGGSDDVFGEKVYHDIQLFAADVEIEQKLFAMNPCSKQAKPISFWKNMNTIIEKPMKEQMMADKNALNNMLENAKSATTTLVNKKAQ
jgi:hypothetical protein